MKNENRKIVGKFSKINLLHRINLQKISQKNGLYLGQLPILEYIIENDGCTQTEISKFMGVTPPSIATSIKRMENSGLVKRQTDASDQRYNRLSITEKGIELAKNCRESFNELDGKMFEGLSDNEREVFKQCLDKMIDNLSTDENKNDTMFSLIQREIKMHSQNI